MQNILLVVRDQALEKQIRRNFPSRNFRLIAAGTDASSLESLGNQKFAAAAIQIGEEAGRLDDIESLRRWRTKLPIIALIEPGTNIEGAQALEKGADKFFCLPDGMGDAAESIRFYSSMETSRTNGKK